MVFNTIYIEESAHPCYWCTTNFSITELNTVLLPAANPALKSLIKVYSLPCNYCGRMLYELV